MVGFCHLTIALSGSRLESLALSIKRLKTQRVVQRCDDVINGLEVEGLPGSGSLAWL